MNKKIIIVAGHLAAGKTTFSLKLSEELRIPCFNKDLLKEEIGRNIKVNNKEDSNNIGSVSFNILFHIVEKFMKVGFPLIIESGISSMGYDNIKKLLKQYNYQSLVFYLAGDLKILFKRFVERDNTSIRDKIHKYHGLANNILEFEQATKHYNEIDLEDKVIRIDTTDFQRVEFSKYIQKAKYFLDE